MKISTARALAAQLNAAADGAEAAGSDEVDITTALMVADDAARADLQAAIDAVGGA